MVSGNIFNSARNALEKLYGEYACFETGIPLFTDARLYEKYKGVPEKGFVKMLDSRGNVQVIRPDATFHVLSYINKARLRTPERLYYITEIVKNDKGDISEILQTGAEFFNEPSPLCESEVIALALESLVALGIDDYRVDIGHSEFINALLDEEKRLSAEDRTIIHDHISKKNALDLEDFLNARKVSPKVTETAIEICMLFGKYEEVFNKAKKLCINDGMRDSLDNLSEIVRLLWYRGYDERIFLDLGFSNRMDYYSGMIFKVYSANASAELISGGRYDRLASRLGLRKSACGFGHHLDLSLPLANFACGDDKIIEINTPRELYAEAVNAARTLREAGYSVSLNDSASKLSIKYESKAYNDFAEFMERIGKK